MQETEDVVRACRAAIKRAKQRGSDKVTPEDLLVGILQVIARFGIAFIGPWTIDLEVLGEAPVEDGSSAGPKVVYSPATAALFDHAARIARQDGASPVELVHLLVTFAQREDGFMAQLKQTYGFSAAEWRAALARWQPLRSGRADNSVGNGAAHRPKRSVEERALLSPDEAADYLGVHTQTIRGYIRMGKLSAHRLAGERALRIRREDLLALLEPYIPEEARPSPR